MPPILILQWLGVALAAKFSLPFFGINLNAYAPQQASGQPANPTKDSDIPADKRPSTPSAVQDFVNQPISVLGVAAITFASVFLIAQLRAAGRDASDSLARTTNALQNPEAAVKAR